MNLTVHIRGFGNFAKFRTFAEISDVIVGKIPGMQSSINRIIMLASGFMMYGGRQKLQG